MIFDNLLLKEHYFKNQFMKPLSGKLFVLNYVGGILFITCSDWTGFFVQWNLSIQFESFAASNPCKLTSSIKW